jgi:hypothetical protein
MCDCARGEERLKLRHGRRPQPLIDFMPLHGPVVLGGASQQTGDVFHREQMVFLHRLLKDERIKTAGSPFHQLPQFRAKV